MKNIALFIFSLLPTLQVTSQNVEVTTYETCINLANGEIHIEIDPTLVSGYSLPFMVNWENTTMDNSGNLEIESLNFELINLHAGNYIIQIKLGSSCEINLNAEVEGLLDDPLIVLRKPKQPTCGYSNGSLTLIPKNGTGPYNFIWEPNATTFEHNIIPGAYMLANIPEGVYCVTITDQACGHSEFCVEINEMVPNVEIEVINDISNCNISCDGELEVSVQGLTSSYTVEWIDTEGAIVGTGTTLDGICDPGLYMAKVYFSDKCQPWIYDILLTCCGGNSNGLQVTFDSELGCNGDNSLEVLVSGGTAPYIYQWNNHCNSSSLTGLAEGEYSVTVTDATGCTGSAEINFTTFEQIAVIKPCENLFDGSVTYQINNPTNCLVDVTYDFSICYDCGPYPLIDNNNSSIITFTLDDLGGGIEYSFFVHMCGCTTEINFMLEEQPFDKTFSNYDEPEPYEFVCNYDLDCKNNEGSFSEWATVDVNHEDCDPSAIPRPCGHIDYYCDPNEPPIATKQIAKKYMRRGEAILLAHDLGVYSSEEIEFQIGGDPCDRLWVCPNAPLCRGLALIGDFGGQWVGNTPMDENGCYKVKCKFLGLLGLGFSYKICGKDYLPSYLAPYYDPTIPISININTSKPPCMPIEKDAIYFVKFLTELEEDVPGFKGSGLHSFIKLNMHKPAIRCVKVIYCDETFELKDHDLDYVICDAWYTGPGGECQDIDGSCEICELPWLEDESIVWCNAACVDKPAELCMEPRIINNNYDDFDISSFSSSKPPQIISRMSSATEFNSFAPVVQNDSMITVNAIYKGAGQHLYHAFSYDRMYPAEFQGLDYLFQHFDSSYAFAVLQNEEISSVKDIFYIDKEEFYESKLESSQGLSLLKNWSESNSHFISGNFMGTLKLDGTTIASSASVEQYFITKIDRHLALLNFRKIRMAGWNFFIDEQTADLAIWSPTTSTLYVDEQLQNGISAREIITLDGSTTGAIRDRNLIISADMKLINYKRGPDFSAYLIVGSGIISLQGSQIYNSSSNKVILLTVKNQSSGSLENWVKSYPISSIDTSSISLEMIGLDSIYLALNTTNSITTDGVTITNNGGSDIVILGYNTSGSLILSDHYGSSSNEKLKDFYYSNGILFLGGELGGTTLRRTIGELDFVTFSPNLNHAFISYKILSDQLNAEGLISSDDPIHQYDANNSKVEIYPNPAKDEVYVKAFESCGLLRIVISNVRGEKIEEKEVPSEILSSGVLFESINWPSGIYIANIISGCSNLNSKPFVIAH